MSGNAMSHDGRYGWDDVQRAKENARAELEPVLQLLVEVAKHRKSAEEVTVFLRERYPHLNQDLPPKGNFRQELYEEENMR